MNEVTPELIAQIATRLYNEIPGANRIPKTEAEASQTASEAAGAPAGAAGFPATGVSCPPPRRLSAAFTQAAGSRARRRTACRRLCKGLRTGRFDPMTAVAGRTRPRTTPPPVAGRETRP